MNKAVQWKLFLMMVLEFVIWGAWLPLIFGYLPSLGFSTHQQILILDAFPVASIIGMFFSNQFADRNFAAEKFLGFSQLVGGLAMLGLGFTRDFWTFFFLMSIHCLLYVPTLSIVNSITFAHLKDPKQFGLVRMGGTIGWVLAAWPFTFIFVDWDKVNAAHATGLVNWLSAVLGSGLTGPALQNATRWTYIVAGIASLLLAAFSLTLPHTPPKKAESAANKFAWEEALRLLSKPFVLVLWIVTFADSFVHNCFFNWAGTFLSSPQVGIAGNWVMPIMSIGQVAEILTMAVLGLALKHLGWRVTMIFGICGHLARFLVFAFFPQITALIVAVNILHGVCYAFFFAAVYIFVDEHFPSDARASAQGLFNVMILGVGVIAANSLGPWLLQSVFTANGVTNFRALFMVPAAVATFAIALMALFFHPPDRGTEAVAAGEPAHA
jgi:MFS family permease